VAGLAASPALAQTPPPPPQDENQQTPAATAQPVDASGVPQPQAATPRPNEDQIVITGFRSSLAAALNEKRNATGVVDVIRAEDIAKFPDNNLAESIQRIPGVTITRDQGEGRNISVRGLGPIYTQVRVNGLEGLGTTGGADASGGANRTRAFDFNIFASDLFNAIVVHKTASADIQEGSLGATVDLVTARPLDFRGGLTVAGQVAGGFNDLSRSTDPRLSGLIAWHSNDRRFGVLFSAAYSERGIFEEGPSTVRWERGTDNGGFNAASTLPTGAQNGFQFFHPRIPRYDSFRYETKRLGLTGSVQFQPTDSTLITLDALYSKFESNRAEQYLEAISFSRSGSGKPQTVILPGAVVDDTNSLVSGTFDNVDVRVESRFDELETTFKQLTLGLHQDFGSRLRFDGLAGISNSDFKNPIQTTIALDALNVDGYSFDFSQGRNPTFDYGTLDVENPASFVLGEIRLRPQFVENDFRTIRGQLEFDATDSIKLRAGGDYRRYVFDSKEFRRASETNVPVLAPGVLATLTNLYSISSRTPTAGTPDTFIVPDLDAFDDALDFNCNCGIYTLTGNTNNSAQGNWRKVRETDTGGFVQGLWNFELGGGVRLRGDVGVRFVHTKQFSSGFTGGALAIPVTASRSYDNWLPSGNLVAEFGDFVARAAIARVITRPNLGFLSPTGAFSISGGNRTYTLGNPDLDPIKATNYDLSFEWYFARESALVLGAFYKDVSTFIANTAQQIPFNQLGLPASLLNGTTVQPTDLFTVTQPINSDGGKIKGVEIGIQMPFRFLPGLLRNLGAQANYTYVKSNIKYPLSTAPNAPFIIAPLTDLSKHSANATLYYEDKRFSIRGSLAYRSKYVQAGGVPGRNGVSPGNGPNFDPRAGQPTWNDVEGVHGTLNVDASASFKINENFTVFAEGLNLTDEYVDQFIDSAADRLSVYHHTGRQYYAGVRVKF
jgi:TonB-dependent receptor